VTGPAPVVLAGRWVRLEPLTIEHGPALAHAAAGDRSTFGFTHVPDGIESARAYVHAALEDQARGNVLPFAILSARSGRVVGSTRFLDLQYWALAERAERPEGTPVAAEIGATWLAPDAQRTPVNTEAKLVMLRHAFQTWQVQRVSLKTDARNARSRVAIERLGARFDGVLRRFSPAVDGGLRDAAFYSILDSEWPAIRADLQARLSTAPTP
jgi:N-acetyltransferase